MPAPPRVLQSSQGLPILKACPPCSAAQRVGDNGGDSRGSAMGDGEGSEREEREAGGT